MEKSGTPDNLVYCFHQCLSFFPFRVYKTHGSMRKETGVIVLKCSNVFFFSEEQSQSDCWFNQCPPQSAVIFVFFLRQATMPTLGAAKSLSCNLFPGVWVKFPRCQITRIQAIHVCVFPPMPISDLMSLGQQRMLATFSHLCHSLPRLLIFSLPTTPQCVTPCHMYSDRAGLNHPQTKGCFLGCTSSDVDLSGPLESWSLRSLPLPGLRTRVETRLQGMVAVAGCRPYPMGLKQAFPLQAVQGAGVASSLWELLGGHSAFFSQLWPYCFTAGTRRNQVRILPYLLLVATPCLCLKHLSLSLPQ